MTDWASHGMINNIPVKNITVQEEEQISRRRLSDRLEYRESVVVRFRFSFAGPFFDDGFEVKTDNFILKNCVIYQYTSGRAKGFCDLYKKG